MLLIERHDQHATTAAPLFADHAGRITQPSTLHGLLQQAARQAGVEIPRINRHHRAPPGSPSTASPDPPARPAARPRPRRAMTATLLNGPHIRARRVALGLTIAKPAAHLGIGSDLARALEGGATSRVTALPLAVLPHLARTLHLAPAELFTAAEPDPVAAGADDRAIEAALLAHGDTITTDSLA